MYRRAVRAITTQVAIATFAERAAVGFDGLAVLLLFAEGDAANGAGPGSSWALSLLPFVAIAFLFYFLLIRPQRSEQSRRQQMLAAIKKNDRVVTIGGVYGIVTNVQKEADEVTIRVDEKNDTKLRVQLSAVARVLGSEGEGGDNAAGKT